jgi:hypothetical protein
MQHDPVVGPAPLHSAYRPLWLLCSKILRAPCQVELVLFDALLDGHTVDGRTARRIALERAAGGIRVNLSGPFAMRSE